MQKTFKNRMDLLLRKAGKPLYAFTNVMKENSSNAFASIIVS